MQVSKSRKKILKPHSVIAVEPSAFRFAECALQDTKAIKNKTKKFHCTLQDNGFEAFETTRYSIKPFSLNTCVFKTVKTRY